MDIFISYRSDDRTTAEIAVRALRGAGYSVWWDQDLREDAQYLQDIDTDHRKARLVIVFWSENAFSSSHLIGEAQIAHREKRYFGVCSSDEVRKRIMPPFSIYKNPVIDFLTDPDAGAILVEKVEKILGKPEDTLPNPDDEFAEFRMLLLRGLQKLDRWALMALCESLKQETLREAAKLLEAGDNNGLVNSLFDLEDFDDLLVALVNAIEKLIDDRRESSAEVICELSGAIAPLIWTRQDSTIAPVRDALEKPAVGFVEIPVGHFSMAEALMAAAESKRAQHRPRLFENDDPLGLTALPMGPECGPDEDGSRQSDTLVQHIRAVTSLADVEEQILRMEQHPRETFTQRERAELARNLRRRRRRREQRAYYVVALKPEDEKQFAELVEVMRQVREKLPPVVTLIIDPTVLDDAADDTAYYLRYTIPLKREGAA